MVWRKGKQTNSYVFKLTELLHCVTQTCKFKYSRVICLLIPFLQTSIPYRRLSRRKGILLPSSVMMTGITRMRYTEKRTISLVWVKGGFKHKLKPPLKPQRLTHKEAWLSPGYRKCYKFISPHSSKGKPVTRNVKNKPSVSAKKSSSLPREYFFTEILDIPLHLRFNLLLSGRNESECQITYLSKSRCSGSQRLA